MYDHIIFLIASVNNPHVLQRNTIYPVKDGPSLTHAQLRIHRRLGAKGSYLTLVYTLPQNILIMTA